MLNVVEHDYVIVDDVDANYLQIAQRKIETELYYRTVNRLKAEDILIGREDGSCLVRPYNHMWDETIRYIISVYVQQQILHLYIRYIKEMNSYAIGQKKNQEKLFVIPTDIIEFYQIHPLLCRQQSTGAIFSVFLKPIVF